MPKSIHKKTAGGVGNGWLVIDSHINEIIIGQYFKTKKDAYDYSNGIKPNHIGKKIIINYEKFLLKYNI